jgi:uncharacterized protein
LQIYYPYSSYLKKTYGEKVYKLPINVPGTCPNRDGSLGETGCYYCAEVGAGFESLSNTLSVKDQLLKNKEYIGKRYGAKKFIAYFQNYTGTYAPIDLIKKRLTDALIDDGVCINISTRPDCISNQILNMLADFKAAHNVDIHLEVGLQTANDKTLVKIGRGHDLAQFIDAVLRIKRFGLSVSVHVIIDFCYDDLSHVINTSRIISALGVDGVKIHSLYIAKNSVFGQMYQNGEITLLSEQEYIERAVAFLQHLSPTIYVERLIGRIPQDDSLIANFGKSWWVVKEAIEKRMADSDSYQGIKCDYLDGSALNKD